MLDIIGEAGDDPGSGWDVAGVSNGTKDHTIVRKSSVECCYMDVPFLSSITICISSFKFQ